MNNDIYDGPFDTSLILSLFLFHYVVGDIVKLVSLWWSSLFP